MLRNDRQVVITGVFERLIPCDSNDAALIGLSPLLPVDLFEEYAEIKRERLCCMCERESVCVRMCVLILIKTSVFLLCKMFYSKKLVEL